MRKWEVEEEVAGTVASVDHEERSVELRTS